MLGKWNGYGRPAAWRMDQTACPSSLPLRRSAATLDRRRSSAPSCNASAPFRASPPSQKCRGRPCPLRASRSGPATHTWWCRRRTKGPKDRLPTAHTRHPLRRTTRWPPRSSSTSTRLTPRLTLCHTTRFQALRACRHTSHPRCRCRCPTPSRMLRVCRCTSPRLCLHPCRALTALLAVDTLTTRNATNTLIPRHLHAVHTNIKDILFCILLRSPQRYAPPCYCFPFTNAFTRHGSWAPADLPYVSFRLGASSSHSTHLVFNLIRTITVIVPRVAMLTFILILDHTGLRARSGCNAFDFLVSRGVYYTVE